MGQRFEQLAVYIDRHCLLILVCALFLCGIAFKATSNLSVSTKLEALMPEEAHSVKNLHQAMEKAGSFASVQVLVRGANSAEIERILVLLEAVIRPLPWSESVQYFEDISVLERHKLLQLNVAELEEIEEQLEDKILTETFRAFEENVGVPLRVTLAGKEVTEQPQKTQEAVSLQAFGEKGDATQKRFVSDDGKTHALVVWPKSGFESLSDAKRMVSDVEAILHAFELDREDSRFQVGIAGRIRNKVAQFDAVMQDVVVGLGTSVALIVLLLLWHYWSLVAVPLIVLPLVTGILWTIGLTAVVIGNLNLITVFLALILFGLGIDFGIHNFSRYSEVRAKGVPHRQALSIILGHTGKASLAAGLTSAVGFLSLVFTEFRAFREFGFIAGSGILLIYVSMYTVFPALVSASVRYGKWSVKPFAQRQAKVPGSTLALLYEGKVSCYTLLGILLVAAIALLVAPNMEFEKNFKNIQASRSADHLWATEQSKNIFKGGHDRAVLVVESIDEVKAIESYFEAKAKTDLATPTIAKITSIRNFVPDAEEQEKRLHVINRMWGRVADAGVTSGELSGQIKYLQIDGLEPSDLPPVMQRVYLGNTQAPGYLMYIYNSVTMDDADLARQFYDDAAAFTVNETTYYPASEGFIFVEMLALMKADALHAVLLVCGVTAVIVSLFLRSVPGTLIVLTHTALVLLFTIALMSVFGVRLSIINMVILPSLVGIAVDNAIHVYERFREGRTRVSSVMATTGKAASLTTLTTLMGFGGLVTASMGGLQSMGILAIIGFSVCLLMTWTLLPALLALTSQSSLKQFYNVRLWSNG